MQRNRILAMFALGLGLALAGSTAATPELAEGLAIGPDSPVAKIAPAEDPEARFCRGWLQLKPGMPFAAVVALGIDMNGSCTPGTKAQSFHQPYMDLYFDADCRALHGATTIDC